MASEKELNIKINTEADTSSVSDLQNLLEEVKSQMENLSTNVDTSGVDDVGNSASNVASQVSEASSSVEEFKGEVGSVSGSGFDDVANSVEDINKSMEDVKQNQLDIGSGAMLNFVSSNLQSVSSSAEGMAQGMNEASITVGQLATQSHMSEDAMVSLVNEISNVTFPNDEAMMYIKNLNQMGVDSSNFGKSATNIDRINDAFGLGARTTNSLATELSVLGVDMNDVSSSFNALAYANANTKGGMENFYTFLRKYDSELHDMGYNVDQASVIIAGATQKFGGGRAALSGLSNALKEANGDSRKLEEALGLQAGSLDNASQITGEYQGELQKLANEEMEHKTLAQRLGAVWEDVSLSLGNTLSPLLSVAGALSQFGSIGLGYQGIKILAKDLGKFKDKGIKGNIDSIKNSFSNLKTNIGKTRASVVNFGSTIKNKLSNISIFNDEKGSLGGGQAKTFDSLKQKVTDFANTTKTKLSSAFNIARTKAVSFATTLKTSLVNGFNSAKQGIINLATSIKTTLVTAFQGAITKAKTLALGLLDLGKKALISGYNALKSAGMWLVEKASLIASAVAKGVATVSSWALAVAEWAVASPILIIVAIVLILIGVLIYLYNTNETVRNAINNLGQTFIMIGQTIYNAFMNAVNMVVGFLTNLWNYITSIGQMILQSVGITGNNIMSSILGFIVFMATLPLQIGIIFTNIIAKALGFGDNFAQRMLSAGMNSVKNFIGQIATAYNKLKTELSNMLKAVGEWALTLPQKFWDAGVNAVKQFLSALGIASPGIMQRTLVWEISEMGKRVPEESQNLLTNVGRLGTNIVDEFGEPSLGINYDDTANATIDSNLNGNTQGQGGNTFNINIGNVDSEDRVNEIVDAVKKALAFENETAGRNV